MAETHIPEDPRPFSVVEKAVIGLAILSVVALFALLIVDAYGDHMPG